MRLTTLSLTAATALLAPALLLGACQQEAPAPAPAKQEITVRSANQKALSAANDLNRAIALKRAIMETGSSCKRVASTGFVGTYKNMDFWTASCVDSFDRSRDWAVFVGADDSVQVRLCADTVKVGLPACTAKAGTEGGSGVAAPTKKRAG